MSTKGKFFLILGPSGVGKGTLISILKEKYKDFYFPVSMTTRAMRPGEIEGDVYFFTDKEDFKKRIDEGEFLEYAVVHSDNFYGTLKKPIFDAMDEGKVVIREVDVQGVQSIREIIPSENLVTIFITAPDFETLVARIQGRSELPEEEVERRMESARKEFAYASECDYVVESLENQIPKCVEDVVSIIEKEMKGE